MTTKNCRICLAKNVKQVSLFTEYKNAYSLVDIVHKLTNLEIIRTDQFSDYICELCADKLVDFYLFRQQILESQCEDGLLKSELSEESQDFDTLVEFGSVNEEEGNPIIEEEDANEPTRQDATKLRKAESSPFVVNSETLLGKSKKFNCDVCSRGFRRPSSFLCHFRNVHMKQFKRKKCPHCPRLFTISSGSTSSLHRHILAVHKKPISTKISKPKIRCYECGDVFEGTIAIYEHSKIHGSNSNEREDGYDLHCDDCNVDLETFDKFAGHMRDKHGIENEKDLRPVRCRWCGKRCKSFIGLNCHIRFNHICEGDPFDSVYSSDMIKMTPIDKQSVFLCNVCGSELSCERAYQNHMTIHTGNKPFACDICSATFRQKRSLTVHQFTHTNERNYLCSECPKTFRQNSHLKTHLKTHGIGIKEKFSCAVCNKEFLFRGALAEHKWVHLEGQEKPHVCKICGKDFIRKHKLVQHEQKEHESDK